MKRWARTCDESEGENYGARVFVTLINWQYKYVQNLIVLGSQSKNKVFVFPAIAKYHDDANFSCLTILQW